MRMNRKIIEWLKRDEGNEIDYTAHYEDDRHPFEEGRLSLRYNGNSGVFEFYVHWLDSGEDEVLKNSKDFREIVEWANKFMRSIGYTNWNDTVEV